jgi:hypothetical protein
MTFSHFDLAIVAAVFGAAIAFRGGRSGIIQAITSLTYNRTTAMWLPGEGAATAAPAANADPVRPIRSQAARALA